MPFTPSHAVVALPFIRTPLVPAAIAIGAMTPDLPLFVRGFGVNYAFTHTPGNVAWTMVIAFGLFMLWRVVLRPVATELSPDWMARRQPTEWQMPVADAVNDALGVGRRWTHAVLLVASLLIGVLSHIVWDAFTHEGRWGIDLLPVLGDAWGPLPGHTWLQHGSSILGLLLLAGWALWWLRRAEPRAHAHRTTWSWVRVVWWLSLPIALIIGWSIGLAVHGPITEDFTVRHLAYRSLPQTTGVWAMLTLALCVAITVFRREAPARGRQRR